MTRTNKLQSELINLKKDEKDKEKRERIKMISYLSYKGRLIIGPLPSIPHDATMLLSRLCPLHISLGGPEFGRAQLQSSFSVFF